MTGRPGIDGYLSEVAAVLHGPARARDDIIAELRSGLLDAADAYRAAGHSPDEAAAAATAEFGDPRQIAAGFGPELAAREARRLARDLIITGPLVGLLWAAAATASHVGIRHAPPWQWRGMPPASLFAVPLFGAVLLQPPGPSPAGCPPARAPPPAPPPSPASPPRQPTSPSSSCSPASSPARQPPSPPRPSSPPPPPA